MVGGRRNHGQKIVICGATGSQGRAVVRHLLAGACWDVGAVSRTPENAAAAELARAGAQVVRGDLLDRGSLIDVFRGAYGVFGVTQPWSPDYKKCDVVGEVRQGKNIVDACLETAVEHLVLSPVLLLEKGKNGVAHVDSKIDIEAYARATKVP